MVESTKSVLIVEDETAIRHLVCSVLSPRYQVFQAPDAEHALRAFDGTSKLDLLLTDVVMPGMDGFALADHLRADHPDLRIVFISGFFSTAEFQNRVHRYGAQFLRKPFSIPALLAIVDRVLEAPDGDGLRAGDI